MFTLAVQLLYHESVRLLKRCKPWWTLLLLTFAPALVQTRCARRMDQLAARLLLMRGRIEGFEQHLRDDCAGEQVDADRSIRRMLRELKQDIRVIRCELAGIDGMGRPGYGAQRLKQALARLHRVAEDTYLAADHLLWEIEQMDARPVPAVE